MSDIRLDFIDRSLVRRAREAVAELDQADPGALGQLDAVCWLARITGHLDVLLGVLAGGDGA